MTLAVLQARVGSTRFPKKVLKKISGRPMLWHQIQRVKLAKSLSNIIVATTDQPEDEAVIQVAQESEVSWATGSQDDVLDRVYQAVKDTDATSIVRLTGDCPLIDPKVIDQVIQYYHENSDHLDYLCLGPEWPEGFDIEIFSRSSLEKAWLEADKKYEREHVTPYIAISGKFRVHRLPCDRNLSHLRLTVDEEIDYTVVSDIYDALYHNHGHAFGLTEILGLYALSPEIFHPNIDIQRNEGFLKSLKEERSPLRYDPKPFLEKTDEIWKRAESLIPSGTQTLSKGPTQYVQGIAPKYLQRGNGSHVWDVDGNEYIDYPMGLGAIILGHAYPTVNQAIQRQLDAGISYSLMHPLEVELAETLTNIIPWAEMVRFAKNGSDATTGAVRAARAITNREMVFHSGYHGWHDWYVTSTTRNRGVPKSAFNLQEGFIYNDLDSLTSLFEKHSGQVAAVIMEPYGIVDPKPGFLEGVAKITHDNGALLIFDEVATGFRFNLGGVDQRFGVYPDLACFGKAMGNGMPISAIVGRRETMAVFDQVFYSFTAGGECLSLASAIATINEMQVKDVFGHIWEMGNRLQTGYNKMVWDLKLEKHTSSVGLSPRSALLFLDEFGNNSLILKSLFQQEVLKRGVLFGAAHCISFSHTEDDIDMTLAAYYDALTILKAALDEDDIESKLEGTPIQPVFRPL